jgi:hypothetical protein
MKACTLYINMITMMVLYCDTAVMTGTEAAQHDAV